ncbi:D-arabinono-1,4-lactone oxidase [Conyzicola lurida]|uniref:D-arabinono-1,4-lactone oxidase n=1 Tax=Conyzicola lurida TaxID=1172621 RepID=UPI001C867E93|nr:D-arabinono-1,4-lactone oxidase [Conyzicola lurida]
MLRPGAPWSNWGRSESAHPAHVATPTSVDEIVEIVGYARDNGLTVKPVGAGHSFTAIAATTGIQLDIGAVDGVLAVDGNLVTLAAGTNLHQLPAMLAPYGLALANMGDIDRQTVAGATSTGTHGTGREFGGLATQIRAVTLVTADGGILRVSETENADLFPAARLGLGALGVLVDATVECVPAFLLSAVETPENFDAVVDGWEERVAAHDHFEFYVWPHTDRVLSKYNTRLAHHEPRHPVSKFGTWWEDEFMSNRVLAAKLELGRMLPKTTPAVNRLATRITGNRSYTDVSHEVFVSPRRTRFVEMEYAVPLEVVPEILREIRRLIDANGWIISFPIEVRAAAPDDVWLSTAHGRPTGYIALHRYWREDPTEYFRTIERIMMNYGGRPHWGKMHTRTAESLREAYPRFDDFVAVRDRLDPQRLFGNAYLERVLGA